MRNRQDLAAATCKFLTTAHYYVSPVDGSTFLSYFVRQNYFQKAEKGKEILG